MAAGYRSFIGWWIGGAGSVPPAPPPAPTHSTDDYWPSTYWADDYWPLGAYWPGLKHATTEAFAYMGQGEGLAHLAEATSIDPDSPDDFWAGDFWPSDFWPSTYWPGLKYARSEGFAVVGEPGGFAFIVQTE